MLLIGAGLLIRSFQRLREVDPGFDPHGVLTETLGVSRSKFAQPLQQVAFFDRVLDRVRSLPGVMSAGVVDSIPLGGGGSHEPIAVEGYPVVPMSEQPEVDVRRISAGYVSALHIPILRGRDFNDSDRADSPETVLISAALAHQFWPNENPLGKHITLTFFPGPPREVVGVIGDVKDDGLNQSRAPATLYVPLPHLGPSTGGPWRSYPMTLVVRSSSNSTGVVSAVSAAVQEIDREVPIRDVLTMDDLVANSLTQQRFNLLLLGAFAGLALVLAAIGIYSVLSYSVRRRIQEIGVRLALGASLPDIFRMIVVEGMKPALLGVTLGAVGALALGKVMASFVYGIKPTDPLTFIAVALTLALVALLASIVPAFRAARVDPMVALRYE
jgi:predicted permease